MEVLFQTPSGKSVNLQVESNFTIQQLKQMLKEKEGYEIPHLQLIFAEQVLENDKTLSFYNILHNSTLHVVLICLE